MSATDTVQIQSRPIYTAPGGKEIREFSHAQYSTYKECPKKYEFRRVRGWNEKQGAPMDFGKSIQSAIELYFKANADPVEVFEQSWLTRKDAKLDYSEDENWETFRVSGVGLMNSFKRDPKRFPPRTPEFFDFRNALRIRDQATGFDYKTIPDLIDRDPRGSYIADIKALNTLINESVPHLVANDFQLRTQAAAIGVYRVALWNFCRKPKRVDAATREEIFTECHGDNPLAIWVVRETNALTIDAAGEFLRIENHKLANDAFKAAKKANPALSVEADRIIAVIKERHKPQYIIQWVESEITREHAIEAVREEMSVIPQIQSGYFPRTGGVRYPNNICVNCKYRGLCMEELFGSRPEYAAVTSEELIPWDARAMEDLD